MTCIVRPNGSIECLDMEFMMRTPTEDQRSNFKSWIEGYFGCEWCDEKIDLALRILRRLDETPISCDRLDARATKVVGSVYLHLEQDPASIQLFNYDTMPADALGAWVHALKGFKAVRELHRRFDGSDHC